MLSCFRCKLFWGCTACMTLTSAAVFVKGDKDVASALETSSCSCLGSSLVSSLASRMQFVRTCSCSAPLAGCNVTNCNKPSTSRSRSTILLRSYLIIRLYSYHIRCELYKCKTVIWGNLLILGQSGKYNICKVLQHTLQGHIVALRWYNTVITTRCCFSASNSSRCSTAPLEA